MIQDTTLRMVVEAVDRASAPLESVKDKVDGLSNSIDGTKAAAEDALPAVGKAATDVVDDFEDLGQSASRAASFMGPAMVEAAVVAGVALISLAKYIKEVSDEHARIQNVADNLALPYELVNQYSESWQGVAQNIERAARGFTELSEAQARALKALGVPATGAGTVSALTKIAASTGTRQEKIDALSIISGKSYEESAKELDAELKRLGEIVFQYRDHYDNQIAVTRGQLEGVDKNPKDLSQMFRTGELAGPATVKKGNEGRAELERVRKARADGTADAIKEMEKEQQARERAAEKAARLAERSAEAAKNLEESNYREFERAQDARRRATEAAVREQDRAAKETQKQWDDAWNGINKATDESLRATFKDLEVPVNEFVETWKDAMKDMVFFGDFSFKRLVARIIVQLTSRELFAAIDRVGDALDTALSAGGGGLIGGVKSFFKGIFGGNAGGGTASGVRLVGEEEPELVASGPNTMRVYNMRQMAFAAGGGAAQPAPVYNDNRTYTISGVETQQVVAYIENTRREDQRGMLRMLERNGFGSMR